MKKILSIMLILIMLLSLISLAGCDSNEENNSDDVNVEQSPDTNSDDNNEVTEEVLKNSKPNEYIQEKLDAGMEVIFGYAAIADNFFTNQILGEGIRQYVEPLGMSYSFQSAAEDVATLITIIENYAQMGAAICTILPPDGSVVQNVVEQAQEKGTTCIVWGTSADYDTVVATYDNSTYGNAIGEMTMAWVNTRFPDAGTGEVKTAFQYQTTVVDVIERKDGVMEVLNNNPCISIEYEVDNPTNTLDWGFSAAEEAFTVCPDLNVFIWLDLSSAVGGNNYVMSRPDLDKSSIGFFTGGYDDIINDLLVQSETDESVLRGIIQDGESTADSTIAAIDAIIAGEITLPYLAYQPMFSKVAGFEYHFDSREA